MNISLKKYRALLLSCTLACMLSACTDVDVPNARNTDIPTPVSASTRKQAVNERPDSVMYLPLGEDVLMPETLNSEPLPDEDVGPYELRGETLAGALQLILADYDISLAFETEEGLSKQITVANLRGSLDDVVNRICSLANLYCSYEKGVMTVKDTETFTVTLPPIGSADAPASYMPDISTGLSAVLGNNGTSPVIDSTTRTMIYTATARSAEMASRYFQRLRANTAMIVFETYIWEVSLNAGNSTGIDWDMFKTIGQYNMSFSVVGSAASDFTNPVSIGLPTTQTIGATPSDLVEFLAKFGAVKTISQPQITVLSGSSATMTVADTQNYVSQIATTITDSQSTTSASTSSVDSGFTLNISSSWDKSTVYANISIDLTNVLGIDDITFSDGGTTGTSTSIQLPQTTSRELQTQVRIRPGDSLLIAGLVQEQDNFDTRGPGFMEPILPDSRTAKTENLELVFLLRPRVVAYVPAEDPSYKSYVTSKSNSQGQTDFTPMFNQDSTVTPALPPVTSTSTPADTLTTTTSPYTPTSGRYTSGYVSRSSGNAGAVPTPQATTPTTQEPPTQIFDITGTASSTGGKK